jgi:predicted ATPase/alkylhydroperoxidase/carboxymuconolactone decarboxylase family protein YurZ
MTLQGFNASQFAARQDGEAVRADQACVDQAGVERNVFICYSSVDAQDAREICHQLEGSGIKCWIAPRDPVPGIAYGQQIVNAIEAAHIVLLVFSANANDSRAVLGELELASNRKKIILPVRIEDVSPSASLEFYVRPIHWFDAATRPREEAWPELLRDVQSLLGQTQHVTAKAEEPQEAAEPQEAIGPVYAPQHNLPSALTSFVGRDAEVAEVEVFLESSRLVTLCGPGGIGKTLLALHVAMRRRDNYTDGAWFADLAKIEDGSLVAQTLATVFELAESANRTIVDALLAYLRSRNLLIVLDCCEHVIADAARITETILQACPRVAILTTTRESLDVPGERVFRVPSLALPQAEAIQTLSAAAALEFDAIALFADRAMAANSRFVLNDANAPTVAKICNRLDGIALAIELAAARVKLLSVSAIAESLNERFGVLTGGSRTALPRQKTLRAMIDWSYDLLTEKERDLFRRLAVFAGGFSLELAIAVCARDADAGAELLDLLASVVDKSLVQADFVREEARYHLLESMRAYAHEKLVQQDELELTTRAYAAAYLELAEKLEALWETTPEKAWKLQAEPEMENWRATLRWAFSANGDIALGQRLVAALRPAFTMAPSEGRRWIQAALESIDDATPAPIVARLSLSCAHLAMLAQQYHAALPEAERALQLFTQVHDEKGIALANMFVGAARGFQGETAAGMASLQKALNGFRRLGARREMGGTLWYLGILELVSGNVSAPRALLSEALELYESVGAAGPAAHIASSLAELEYQNGNASKAARLLRQGLAAERKLKDLHAVTFDLCNLAAYLVALGKWEEAKTHAREALALGLDRQVASATIWAIHHLAAIAALRPSRRVAAALDDRRRAARLIGFVDARLTEFKMRRDFTEQKEFERIMAALDEALHGEVSRLGDEGGTWSIPQAAQEAGYI